MRHALGVLASRARANRFQGTRELEDGCGAGMEPGLYRKTTGWPGMERDIPDLTGGAATRQVGNAAPFGNVRASVAAGK